MENPAIVWVSAKIVTLIEIYDHFECSVIVDNNTVSE